MNYKLVEIVYLSTDEIDRDCTILSEEKLRKILKGELKSKFNSEHEDFFRYVELNDNNEVDLQETLEYSIWFYPGKILEIKILNDNVDKNIVKRIGILDDSDKDVENTESLDDSKRIAEKFGLLYGSEENDLSWKTERLK